MTRHLVIALFFLVIAAPVHAQSATPAAAPASAVVAVVPPEAPKADDVNGFPYRPEGRRDPFVSLLRRAPEVERGPAGARAPGLAGLGAGEVTLKGTMQGRDGYVAMLLGADTKTYIVRSGDHLLDGTIRAITANEMVIVQQVHDPLSPQKQREVRKLLRQTEEAK